MEEEQNYPIIKVQHGGIWLRWNKLLTSSGYRYKKLFNFFCYKTAN